MEFNFKVKYQDGSSEFDDLDLYYGSNSLAAISEILMIATHAVINEEIIVRAPAAKGFRVVFKRSYIGSFEQFIQLYATSTETLQLIDDLGKNGLYDFLKYLLSSCLGLPFAIKNRKAKRKMQTLMQENEDLHERLERALIRVHQPVKHQGYNVQLSLGRTPIITFDKTSLDYLETEVMEPDSDFVSVAVSRFNARTGTGRFITDIDSISFSFSPEYDLDDYQKTLMADNLGEVARGEFNPLIADVTRITSRDGRLKRYLLRGITAA